MPDWVSVLDPDAVATDTTPYRRIARFYDAIYLARGRSASDEVEYLSRFWTNLDVTSEACRILDAGCGTGVHLPHLSAHGTVTGIDGSPDMIHHARLVHPDHELLVEDLRGFDLGRSFDVVTCLFGAIAYLTEPKDLARGLAALGRHVAGRGVLLLEPPLLAETMSEPRPQHVQIEFDGGLLSRETKARRDGQCLEIDFCWRFEPPGAGRTEEIHETHRLLALDSETWLRLLEEGLPEAADISLDREGPIGRGLFVARFTPDGGRGSG